MAQRQLYSDDMQEYVPDSSSKLRACLVCRLVLSSN